MDALHVACLATVGILNAVRGWRYPMGHIAPPVVMEISVLLESCVGTEFSRESASGIAQEPRRWSTALLRV
jgi:hypothetical protein